MILRVLAILLIACPAWGVGPGGEINGAGAHEGSVRYYWPGPQYPTQTISDIGHGTVTITIEEMDASNGLGIPYEAATYHINFKASGAPCQYSATWPHTQGRPDPLGTSHIHTGDPHGHSLDYTGPLNTRTYTGMCEGTYNVESLILSNYTPNDFINTRWGWYSACEHITIPTGDMQAHDPALYSCESDSHSGGRAGFPWLDSTVNGEFLCTSLVDSTYYDPDISPAQYVSGLVGSAYHKKNNCGVDHYAAMHAPINDYGGLAFRMGGGYYHQMRFDVPGAEWSLEVCSNASTCTVMATCDAGDGLPVHDPSTDSFGIEVVGDETAMEVALYHWPDTIKLPDRGSWGTRDALFTHSSGSGDCEWSTTQYAEAAGDLYVFAGVVNTADEPMNVKYLMTGDCDGEGICP